MVVEDKEDIMVMIRCYTYNQEKYIREALEGFVMQKTDFPFVAVVVDDASTDGTADIIKEYEEKYPEIIRAYYLEENHYQQKKPKFSYFQDIQDRSKYIALCEGDDYWTDPYKLQKQVDFLEENPDYGLVHTNYSIYNEDKNKFIKVKNKTYSTEYIYEDLLCKDNLIATLTVLVRTSLLNTVQKEIKEPRTTNGWKMGDLPLWLGISRISKVGYLKDNTAIYRLLRESASHSKNIYKVIDFMHSVTNIKLWFCNKYDTKDLIPIIKENELYSIYMIFIRAGKNEFDDYGTRLKNHNLIERTTKKTILYYTSKINLLEKFMFYFVRYF